MFVCLSVSLSLSLFHTLCLSVSLSLSESVCAVGDDALAAGDAYFCASNLVKDQADHTLRIARFAMDAVRAAQETLVCEAEPVRGFINIRVGMASRP